MPEAESIPPISVMQRDGVRVVEFTQNKILDPSNIAEIEQSLVALIDEEQNPKLVLDFSNVDNLSSSALGMLVSVRKHMLKKNGSLRLANIKPPLYEVFVITNLNREFEVRAGVDDAIASMSRRFTSE